MLGNIHKYIRTVVLAAVLAPALPCAAQNDKPVIRFETDSWDFGRIREADGTVSHIFTFANISSGPIVIERVTTDCGCTVPKYSSEPVRPGRQGSVEVVFDPAGYMGDFTKTVSVFSNNGRSRSNLKIKGFVIARDRTPEEMYPFPLADGIRADKLRASFDYIVSRSVKSMIIEFFNSSDKTANISVVGVDGSGYLAVHVPATLAPGGKGTATLTYDLSKTKEPVYGMLTDRVSLSINGKVQDITITAHAIAIEDFSKIDPANIAGCYIDPVFHNFGKVHAGEVRTREITISNTGTAPLIIRNVTSRANTSTDLAAGTTIEAGKTKRFSVTMTARDSQGITTGGLTLITNDPERPMREIRTAMEVVK